MIARRAAFEIPEGDWPEAAMGVCETPTLSDALDEAGVLSVDVALGAAVTEGAAEDVVEWVVELAVELGREETGSVAVGEEEFGTVPVVVEKVCVPLAVDAELAGKAWVTERETVRPCSLRVSDRSRGLMTVLE